MRRQDTSGTHKTPKPASPSAGGRLKISEPFALGKPVSATGGLGTRGLLFAKCSFFALVAAWEDAN